MRDRCGVWNFFTAARTILFVIVIAALAAGSTSCASMPKPGDGDPPADAAAAKENAKLWVYTMARSYDVLMKGAGAAYQGGYIDENQRTDIEDLARIYTRNALKLQDYLDGKLESGTFEEHYEAAYDALAVIRGYLSAARIKMRGGRTP